MTSLSTMSLVVSSTGFRVPWDFPDPVLPADPQSSLLDQHRKPLHHRNQFAFGEIYAQYPVFADKCFKSLRNMSICKGSAAVIRTILLPVNTHVCNTVCKS
ncbi:unnamed protein product [Albugo candida]|uniref:Uncharacterized protein n=1 Tax=Albugo candida TaxID=65357 RepID=A0A024GBJ7_9STRA|nr:unnamed protein product [Albugo candida]|eukprot:CCI44236.1 unnamed protein product [Albugo candida]